MDEKQSLILTEKPYNDDLARSGEVANYYARQDIFGEYHKGCAENTRSRQKNDLSLFSTMLAEMGVKRSIDQLYHDAQAWTGIEYGHVKAFQQWLLKRSYAIGSVNISVTTVRKYCALAFEAGTITNECLDLIRTVKNISHKRGVNIDRDRKTEGIEPRKEDSKKASPTYVSREGVRQLKSIKIDHPKSRRQYDKGLVSRDLLLVHLLAEHALRCSEIVALNIESFYLDTEEMIVYRSKTDTTDHIPLTANTLEVARLYLSTQARTSGPLFVGYNGNRITRRTINARIAQLGLKVGVKDLSPHDLRHHWAIAILKAGNSLDTMQFYGGWNTEVMPLRYARIAGVKHGKLKLSE